VSRKLTYKHGEILSEERRKNEWGLTKKQEQFAQIYVTRPELNQTDCAREAGYSEQNAGKMAYMFLSNKQYSHVLARIESLKQEYYKRHEVTFENHVTKLAELRDLAAKNGNYPAAVSAERYRGMAAGLYIDRKEIMMGKIDQMSREEVLAEISRMKQQYPQLMDISPTFTIEAKKNEPTQARTKTLGQIIQEDQPLSGLDED
jgi:hypothetical protein